MLPDRLIILIWKALLGEIYPSIRAIAIGYTSDRKLTIRYYLDREPTDYDYESISNVKTKILAHTLSIDDFTSIAEEAFFSDKRFGDLDRLNQFIYARDEMVE